VTLSTLSVWALRLAAAPWLLALVACEDTGGRPPEVGSDSLHPEPTPCLIDSHGRVSDNGDRKALCCPDGFVVGGRPMSTCRRGECCWIGDDMGRPPPPPESPGGRNVPPS
jgi:hypothetical protein